MNPIWLVPLVLLQKQSINCPAKWWQQLQAVCSPLGLLPLCCQASHHRISVVLETGYQEYLLKTPQEERGAQKDLQWKKWIPTLNLSMLFHPEGSIILIEAIPWLAQTAKLRLFIALQNKVWCPKIFSARGYTPKHSEAGWHRRKRAVSQFGGSCGMLHCPCFFHRALCRVSRTQALLEGHYTVPLNTHELGPPTAPSRAMPGPL